MRCNARLSVLPPGVEGILGSTSPSGSSSDTASFAADLTFSMASVSCDTAVVVARISHDDGASGGGDPAAPSTSNASTKATSAATSTALPPGVNTIPGVPGSTFDLSALAGVTANPKVSDGWGDGEPFSADSRVALSSLSTNARRSRSSRTFAATSWEASLTSVGWSMLAMATIAAPSAASLDGVSAEKEDDARGASGVSPTDLMAAAAPSARVNPDTPPEPPLPGNAKSPVGVMRQSRG
mmetsp:Transcript_7549/g.34185  ORF Transcript_7549/g.34185 Transcript_7549/m.34185 type:complete len:240 (-) Transcript_7549:837-1556(-)